MEAKVRYGRGRSADSRREELMDNLVEEYVKRGEMPSERAIKKNRWIDYEEAVGTFGGNLAALEKAVAEEVERRIANGEIDPKKMKRKHKKKKVREIVRPEPVAVEPVTEVSEPKRRGRKSVWADESYIAAFCLFRAEYREWPKYKDLGTKGLPGKGVVGPRGGLKKAIKAAEEEIQRETLLRKGGGEPRA